MLVFVGFAKWQEEIPENGAPWAVVLDSIRPGSCVAEAMVVARCAGVITIVCFGEAVNCIKFLYRAGDRHLQPPMSGEMVGLTP
jgi:hypothetical protein